MRVKEMYQLCCISLESPGIGNHPPEREAVAAASTRSLPTAKSHDNAEATVAGVLYKWTNYGKGWRSRWFLLRNGVISYAKIRCPENLNLLTPADDVYLIRETSTNRLARMDSTTPTTTVRWKHHKASSSGAVHLKISSFRESKSDDRRFYIFTATKTLHLRTDSRKDRVAWMQALVSTRGLHPLQPLNDHLSLGLAPNDISVSTERLKARLLEAGTGQNLVKDCEQIMLSEFSEMQGQL